MATKLDIPDKATQPENAQETPEVEIPERKPQPSIEDFDISTDFRINTENAFDEQDPTAKHMWMKVGAAPEVLTRKRMEAVLDKNGKRIEDSMGDFLVRTPRDRWEAMRRRDAKMSLESAKSVVEGDEKAHWETDLEQVAQPKKQK